MWEHPHTICCLGFRCKKDKARTNYLKAYKNQNILKSGFNLVLLFAFIVRKMHLLVIPWFLLRLSFIFLNNVPPKEKF